SASDLVVETHQAYGIALSQQQQRKGRGEPLGVGKLGEPVRRGRILTDAHLRATPRHRSADVEHDTGAEIGLFLVLANDPTIGAGGNLPIDVPKVVARLVRPVISELDREAFTR